MFVVINAYNRNLNKRLARKEKKYLDRSQQLDLVIVVDRLLTGFDALPQRNPDNRESGPYCTV